MVLVTKWRDLVRMSGFISSLVTHSFNYTQIYRQYSAIAHLHTFQFTVAHALGFSVSTSRLLATDLNTETSTQIATSITPKIFQLHFQYHCTVAHIKSSIHTSDSSQADLLYSSVVLVPSTSLASSTSPNVDLFGASDIHPENWFECRCIHLETANNYCLVRPSCLQDSPSARTAEKSQPLYCRRVFTANLHSNGRGTNAIENSLCIMYPCLQFHCLETECITPFYCCVT
jgi:hypothetical protein